MAASGEAFAICADLACNMVGPKHDPYGAKWNAICREHKIGKQVLATVPEGYRAVRYGKLKAGDLREVIPGDIHQWSGLDSLDNYLVLEPIESTTPEPTMASVLRELRANMVGNLEIAACRGEMALAEGYLKWRQMIDSVLEPKKENR